MPVVVDANVLVAARFERDEDHERGLRLAKAFDRGDLPTAYVPSDVLVEVCNYLRRKARPGVAIGTLNRIVEHSGYEVVFTSNADFDTGRSTFRTYPDLSLTDAVVVAFMRRRDIEYLYSFDAGFEAADEVTRVVTPENPFSPE